MKTYDKYKSSGIDWIGDIPEHWLNHRLKTVLVSERNGIWGDESKEDENDVFCLRVADFDKGFDKILTKNSTLRNISERDFEVRELEFGDLLIEKSGGGEISPVGRVGIYSWQDKKAVCSNFMAQLKPNYSKVTSKFLFYYFKKLYDNRVNVKSIKQTTGIQNLDTYSYFSEIIFLPPLPEQTAIADYLDDKTAQIDKLMAEKRRLIELLKEERLGVINQAVTRGINPHAKLKPSGIAWLGDIPEHWEVKKLKWVCHIIDCKHTTPEYIEVGIAVVSTGNVKPFVLSLDSARKVSLSDFEELSEGDRKPLKNDIIYSRNASVGAAALVRTEEVFCLGQDICLIRTKENQDFLENVLNCKYVLVQLESVLVGSTFRRINIQQIKEFFIILPPIEEQKQIVEFIETATGKIDATIATIEKEINFLREYRTALISEVVTGKIKVTDN